MVVIGLDVLRMVAVAVVALAVVFPYEFPVGMDDVADRLGHLGAVATLRPKHWLRQFPRRAEVTWLLGQVHENKAAQVLERHRREAKRTGVDPILHAAARQQLAVLAVDPLVVRADQLAHRAAWLTAKKRAAMSTDVVKGPHLAVVAPDHQQRVGADVQGEEISGPGYLAIVPNEQPAPTPNPLEVGAINIVRREKLARQSPPILARLGSGSDRVRRLGFKCHRGSATGNARDSEPTDGVRSACSAV